MKSTKKVDDTKPANNSTHNNNQAPQSVHSGKSGFISMKDMKIQEGEYMLDILVEVVKEVDDLSDGKSPFEIFVKLFAFNKTIDSRHEKDVTKVSTTIYNQHLMMESTALKRQELEQGFVIIKVFKQGMIGSEEIAYYKLDLMNIYYYNSAHAMEHKWLAMINKNSGHQIRAIMKMSAQLIGPNDQQSQMKIDMTDLKDNKVRLMLPPELSPTVFQWTIRIYRGRNMKIDAEWFGKIDPLIRVTIGENHFNTKHVENTEDPEFNETLFIPSNYPSMVQDIKFELFDWNKIESNKLLATYHLSISSIDANNFWGQYIWINFYTATDISSKAGLLMVKNLIDGNRFGGQLLVKIDREKTGNPRPLCKNPILFDYGSDSKDTKSKLFHTLAEVQKKKGREMSNYDRQPEIKHKMLEIYFEIYFGCNMPNDKSENYTIKITCGEKLLSTIKPKVCKLNDQTYMVNQKITYKMDYINIVDEKNMLDENHIKYAWLYQMADIVITYYVGKNSISYLKINPVDLYLRQGSMKDTQMLKSHWSPTEETVLNKFFPKYHELLFDFTSSTSGCFKERPGYLSFNMHLADKENAAEVPLEMMTYVENEYLDSGKPEQDMVLRAYLFQCNNLPPGDNDGMSDPYLNFIYNNQIIKTDHCDKTLNPQFYHSIDFELKLRPTKDGKFLNRMTKPLFVEVWDYDLLSDDILCSLKIDLYDYDQQLKIKKLLSKTKPRIEELTMNKETLTEEEEKELLQLNKKWDRKYVESCYTNPDAFLSHQKHRPQIYKLKDFIRGEESTASVYIKTILVPKHEYDINKKYAFEPDYISYKMDFYCIGFRNLRPHGIIPIKQPYLYLRLQDLLPKEFKIMTKDIETINSKGIGNNKSLYCNIANNLKLPRDVYLFPTLGVNVRDNFLGLFSFASMNWGSFDINLKKHTEEHIVERLKENEYKYFERERNVSMAMSIMKKANITMRSTQDMIQDRINTASDLATSRHYIPRMGEKMHKINDIYIKAKKKEKIVFKESELKYPTLIEAINGKFKLYPVFKKEGPVFVEMTEYPSTICEPISYGKDDKHYRFVVKFDNKVKSFGDTPYGDPVALDYAHILGYDNGKTYKIGQFVYFATLTKEDHCQDPEVKKYMDRLKNTTLYLLKINEEYEVRLYFLRGINIARKDSDSESDPYVKIYTEKFYYDGVEEHKDDDANPKFYKTFRFRCKIPETNTLTIEMWDYDLICDEMIGYSQISLTERILSRSYMSIMTKPVEERPIYDDASIHEKGRIRYILEVFKCSEIKKDEDREFMIKSKISSKVISQKSSKGGSKQMSRTASKMVSRRNTNTGMKEIALNGNTVKVSKKGNKGVKGKNVKGEDVEVVKFNETDMLNKYPLIKINPIPPRKFQIRLVIWNAEEVPATDMGGTTDAYVKCWVEKMYYEKKTVLEHKSTDTHWFCSNGCPNWNYRQVWDYPIDDVEEEHTLRLQLFDKDLLTSDELIGEVELDFTKVGTFAYEEDMRQGAKVVTDPENNFQHLVRIKWSNEKDADKMCVNLFNKNKKGEDEVRCKLWIGFAIIPYEDAVLSNVGEAQDEPNHDPHLPAPAGRMSFMDGVWGGFFCIAGALKEFLYNLLLIILAVVVIVYSVYSFISSFSGSFVSSLIGIN